MKTNITNVQFYEALIKAGVLKEGDKVQSVHISTNAYEHHVEIDIEYLADECVLEVISELKFNPDEVDDKRLGSLPPQCLAKTCTRPHDSGGRHLV